MPRRLETLALLAPLGLAVPALAQDALSSGSRLQAQLGTTVMVSDQLSREPGVRDKGALLTVSPGVLWRSNRGALQGSVDYSLNAIQKFKTDVAMKNIQHQLKASVRASLVPEHLSVDGQANMGQQALSAFGTQSLAGSQQGLANRAEVGTASITPQMRVRMAGLAQLTVRHTQAVQRTRGSLQGDSNSRSSAVTVSPLQSRRLAWSLEANDLRSSTKLGRDTQTETARIGLVWNPDVDWRANAQGGWERTDLLGNGKRSGGTYGAGLNWQPSPRTSLGANWDHRVVADVYGLNASYRMPRSMVRLSVTRSIDQPGTLGLSGLQSRYDQLFALFASQEPDETRRDLLVRQELQRLGLSPDAPASAGFVSSNPALSQGAQLSWTWTLQRATVTLGVDSRRTERLGAAATGSVDDLTVSSLVRQRGMNLSWSYRLDPRHSLSLVGNWQRTEGDRSELATRLSGLSLVWSASLGRRTQFSATFRHSDFESLLRPYSENALLVSLTQLF